MDTTPLPPDDSQQSHESDGLLEELASLTGLFNPERIWQQEGKLDDLREQQQPKPDEPQPAD